ncbi:uncharacterized protein [Montipora foliosa]|uniref:uncharacterized protein n=1 Tax=Montipora foliosa TaxID=591990 RepID=UPI0035F16F9A
MAEGSRDARGLSCAVCYNNFKSDEIQFVPRNLICGHTYCTGCLNKLAFQARNPGTICCPTCKTETILFPRTFESVRNLPKNFGVLEILEGKEEVQTDGIQKEKEKNKYLCPEHDEALKVYCYTDNCLICIYCQVYGKHAGHDCRLATDIVTTTREELRGWSKRLGDNYDLIKKSRKTVVDIKDSIVNTQQYVRNRIVKHMGVLSSCMRRREVVLKCEVDDKTKRKLELLDAQESAMTDIVYKCEEAYALIQNCQNNDSALVEEKAKIGRIIDEISSLMGKCELEPAETDNLTYYFEYDIAYTLENTIGQIRLLEPGQKEDPLAGLNKHELLRTLARQETRDVATQTDDLQGGNDQPLFQSLLQGLEEIVHTGMSSTPSWNDDPSLELHVHDTESSEGSASESAAEECDGPLERSSDTPYETGEEDESEELEGAVGGDVTLPSPLAVDLQELENGEDSKTSLLQELQKEIDRLRLLSPGGDVISLTDESEGRNDTSVTTESQGAVAEETRSLKPNQRATLLSSYDQSEESTSLSSTHSPSSLPLDPDALDLFSLTIPEQSTLLDCSELLTSKNRSKCSAVDCKNPDVFPSLRCQHCWCSYCPSCAPLALACQKSPIGHSFVSVLRNRGPRIAKVSSRTRTKPKKLKKKEGPPWQCRFCTMLNGPQVLVCLGCNALHESDTQEGRNVCPMCTLVNEPGKIKCELCETELVSKDQVEVDDEIEC